MLHGNVHTHYDLVFNNTTHTKLSAANTTAFEVSHLFQFILQLKRYVVFWPYSLHIHMYIDGTMPLKYTHLYSGTCLGTVRPHELPRPGRRDERAEGRVEAAGDGWARRLGARWFQHLQTGPCLQLG
jgi:hypothetical protein